MACEAHGGEAVGVAGCEGCAVNVSQGLWHDHVHGVFDAGFAHSGIGPHSPHGQFIPPDDVHRSTLGIGFNLDAGHTHCCRDADPTVNLQRRIFELENEVARQRERADLWAARAERRSQRLSATWEHLPDAAAPADPKPFPTRALRAWTRIGIAWR